MIFLRENLILGLFFEELKNLQVRSSINTMNVRIFLEKPDEQWFIGKRAWTCFLYNRNMHPTEKRLRKLYKIFLKTHLLKKNIQCAR